ncbi:MAG: saccharopine dehydrogenase family protein [Leptospirales bacterium]|nr:saccharopine dehydrogenase family protein [Leptospirales bacterium]
MGKVLIIGAGGVGGVVAHKCAQVPEVFEEITLASRTLSRCQKIAAQIDRPIRVEQVDADNVEETARLIDRIKPQMVINVALPYQDLSIMEACLKTGVHYLDTANYESPDNPKFEYKYQWAYQQRFQQAGLMALLGSGFDPGVTNVFCAYAQKMYFDEIHTVDILDCNAGSHGHAFATNFNPEINIREITQNGRYWEQGRWVETGPLEIRLDWDYPEVGVKASYLLYHEELESLALNLRGLQRIRFFMTFGEEYLTHLRVLKNVGMIGIEPILYEGHPVVPLQFLKALLPDPASLAANYTGKTNIGCVIEGVKEGRKRKYYVFNVCDHAACYREVQAQAISYTTGTPAMIGAMLMMTGVWKGAGVFNMEQLDPTPFMEKLNQHGLPWQERWLD